MSETKPSNPQAFPLVVQKPHGVEYFPGMTLRDYFAAKFMAARLANPAADPFWTDEQMAFVAYQRADAMLRAREAKP